MTDEKPPEGAKQIQVQTGDEMSRGRYSNNMIVTHSPEEFLIDWILDSASGAHLVSRVIVSPGHMKRIVAALSDNLKKYENRFGPVKLPEKEGRGFH